jgi:hypothetical protein
MTGGTFELMRPINATHEDGEDGSRSHQTHSHHQSSIINQQSAISNRQSAISNQHTLTKNLFFSGSISSSRNFRQPIPVQPSTSKKTQETKMVRFTSLVVLTAAACVFATSATAFVLPPTLFGQRSHNIDIAESAAELSLQWRPNLLRQQPQTKMSSAEDESSASASAAAEEDDDDDGEFHSSDPARTTIQFLSGLWQLIARGNTLVRGVSVTWQKADCFLFLSLSSFSKCYIILLFFSPSVPTGRSLIQYFSPTWNQNLLLVI